jgi:hypothetical protein
LMLPLLFRVRQIEATPPYFVIFVPFCKNPCSSVSIRG